MKTVKSQKLEAKLLRRLIESGNVIGTYIDDMYVNHYIYIEEFENASDSDIKNIAISNRYAAIKEMDIIGKSIVSTAKNPISYSQRKQMRIYLEGLVQEGIQQHCDHTEVCYIPTKSKRIYESEYVRIECTYCPDCGKKLEHRSEHTKFREEYGAKPM